MNPDVVVIGGGFAGLSAATALAQQHVAVAVLEARPGLGGRASTFTDPATGERVDNGQHVLFGCYHATFAYLERIGTASQVRLQENLAIQVVDRAGQASRLVCGSGWPPPLHLVAGVMRWPALGWRDRVAILRIAQGVFLGGGRATGTEPTVRRWLQRHGQTPRLIELLWEPLAVAALNQPIDAAGAGPFVTVLRRMFGVSRRDSAIGFPLLPLEELYAEPSRRFVEERRGSVRTNAAATIDVRGDVAVVQCRGEELRPRAVICAVPWHALPAVFSGEPSGLTSTLASARRTEASPIVTVNIWFDRAVTSDAFVGLPGRAMQWVFDKQRLFGGDSTHLSVVSSGADELAGRTNEDLIDLALGELREALPLARDAVVRRAVVVRERRASFSVAPGQPPRPSALTPVPGLFLAGDWIDTGLPATIEGAVVSGHRAAQHALAHLRGAPRG